MGLSTYSFAAEDMSNEGLLAPIVTGVEHSKEILTGMKWEKSYYMNLYYSLLANEYFLYVLVPIRGATIWYRRK